MSKVYELNSHRWAKFPHQESHQGWDILNRLAKVKKISKTNLNKQSGQFIGNSLSIH